MISVKSKYRTLLIAIIFINTEIFKCSGENTENKNIPAIETINTMIEENESVDWMNNNVLSMNLRVLEALRYTDVNDQSFSEYTEPEMINHFFIAYYWLDQIPKVKKEDIDECEKSFEDANKDEYYFIKQNPFREKLQRKDMKPILDEDYSVYVAKAVNSGFIPLTATLWKIEYELLYGRSPYNLVYRAIDFMSSFIGNLLNWLN